MNTPIRLEKQTPKETMSERVLAFLDRHALLIIAICIIILFILVGLLFAALFSTVDAGNTTLIPPMTESNGYYYQLKNL